MLRMPPQITRTLVALLVGCVTLSVSVITGYAQEPVGIEFFAEGAGWQRHWSFIPPQSVTPPQLAASAQVRNEIDRFVQSALTRRKLSAAPTADPRTLMRRLSFDLTGLPPQPEQVDAFVADPSDGAYEQLIDRLLASPHFGERMSIYWLDVVRYADSGGYHSDNHRDVALYRDYVS